MSLNRKLSGGLKRPKATDFVDSDSKRNRSDESGPGEGVSDTNGDDWSI